MKQFDGHITNSNSNTYGFYILLPKSVAEWFLNQNIKRVVCTLNGTHSWQAAIMSMGEGRHFIMVNSQLCKQLKLQLNKTIKVVLEADTNTYGVPMPKEMEELLHQNAEAAQLFDKLTAAKQRTLLQIIGKPKSSGLRLIKAIVVLTHLEKQNGQLNFAILNEDLKNNPFEKG